MKQFLRPIFLISLLFYSFGSFAMQRDKQFKTSEKETLDFLDQASRNLYETEALQDHGLRRLAEQREVLVNIHGNMRRLDSSLGRCDETLTELENPFFPSRGVVRSGKRVVHENLKKSSYQENTSLIMEGVMLKRSLNFRIWQKRFFQLEDNLLVYFIKEGDQERKGMIELSKYKEIIRVEGNKKHPLCFELIPENPRAKKIMFSLEKKSELEAWIFLMKQCLGSNSNWHKLQRKSCFLPATGIRDLLWTEKENMDQKNKRGSFKEKENQRLDQIIDCLDRINVRSVMMNQEVDGQIRIIGGMNEGLDHQGHRILTNTYRVRKIP